MIFPEDLNRGHSLGEPESEQLNFEFDRVNWEYTDRKLERFGAADPPRC